MLLRQSKVIAAGAVLLALSQSEGCIASYNETTARVVHMVSSEICARAAHNCSYWQRIGHVQRAGLDAGTHC